MLTWCVTTFTDIGTMAFDDGTATGGHTLRVADRGTSAIYSVDPELKGSLAIASLASGISQPIIPTFCLSDGSVLYTSGSGGTASDTIRILGRTGAPTDYANTRDAQTNTCHGVSPQAGVTPRALVVDPTRPGNAYIADATSAYIRKIQQGTTLATTTTTAIDPTYGGLNWSSFGDPTAATSIPSTSGAVAAVNPAGAYLGVNSINCPLVNYQYCWLLAIWCG